MSNEDIDRTLSADEGIVPSSGFALSVMETVRRDTEAPPPIPFPWKKALPGFVVSVAGAVTLLGVDGGRDSAVAIRTVNDAGIGWIILALLVACLSVAILMRTAGSRA